MTQSYVTVSEVCWVDCVCLNETHLSIFLKMFPFLEERVSLNVKAAWWFSSTALVPENREYNVQCGIILYLYTTYVLQYVCTYVPVKMYAF